MAARAILVAAMMAGSTSNASAVCAVAPAVVAVPEAGASCAAESAAASPASARSGDPAAGVRLQTGGGGRHGVERMAADGSSGLLPLLMLGSTHILLFLKPSLSSVFDSPVVMIQIPETVNHNQTFVPCSMSSLLTL